MRKLFICFYAFLAVAPAFAVTGTLTFDTPSVKVTRPNSGSTDIVFTGTFDVSGTYTAALPFPVYAYRYENNSERLDTTYAPEFLTWSINNIGSTNPIYHGPLMIATVESTDHVGYYNHVYGDRHYPSYMYVYFNYDSQNRTNLASFDVTVIGPEKIIRGNISDPVWPSNLQYYPFTLEFYQNGNLLDSESVYLEDNGDIYAYPTLGNGNFTMRVVETWPWLSQSLPITITNGESLNNNVELINGDSNTDNVIDLGDFDALSASFGLTYEDEQFNYSVDFNIDGVIDLGDFDILAGAFGQEGS